MHFLRCARPLASLLATWSLATWMASCSPATPKAPESKAESSAPDRGAPIGTLAAEEPLTQVPVEADDAQLGSARAAVTIVAFLDFQCGFCRQGFSTLQELRSAYSDETLRIVFKHLPLESHAEAVPAAIVGQAVQEGVGSAAFFQFAARVFAEQGELNLESLAHWAAEVGLEREQYNSLVTRRRTLERVIRDAEVAAHLGVRATPTFFVNGHQVSGAQSRAVFDELIAREIEMMQGADPWQARYQQRVAENRRQSLIASLLEADSQDYRVPVDGSPVTGPGDALVTLVVFSDYECPFCKRADETVRRLMQEYPKTLRVVFKHLPLAFHERARPAATLATTIYEKLGNEAFWQASGELFERSPQLDDGALEAVARKVGLAESDRAAVLEGTGDFPRLERDAQLAEDVVARGTPHFFVNGKRLDGARPIEQFRALIDYELERARTLVAEGVPPARVYEVLQKDAIAPGAPELLARPLNLEGRPSRGPESAPVTIAVFSDYQCPYCRKGEKTLDQLRQLYPDQIRTVWFDFPLPFHDQALPLARAARAARRLRGDEGFWAVHDGIFALEQPSPRLSRAEVEALAGELGLDATAIGEAMNDDSRDEAIQADIEVAEDLGIDGTPAFVIGNYIVRGARPLRSLRRAVDLVLEERGSP